MIYTHKSIDIELDSGDEPDHTHGSTCLNQSILSIIAVLVEQWFASARTATAKKVWISRE